MGELRSFPGKKQDDERQPCIFCHPSYPCHKGAPGPDGKLVPFDLFSCPRCVEQQYFQNDQIHEDGFFVAAVRFRDEITLEGEIEDAEASKPDAAEG